MQLRTPMPSDKFQMLPPDDVFCGGSQGITDTARCRRHPPLPSRVRVMCFCVDKHFVVGTWRVFGRVYRLVTLVAQISVSDNVYFLRSL